MYETRTTSSYKTATKVERLFSEGRKWSAFFRLCGQAERQLRAKHVPVEGSACDETGIRGPITQESHIWCRALSYIEAASNGLALTAFIYIIIVQFNRDVEPSSRVSTT